MNEITIFRSRGQGRRRKVYPITPRRNTNRWSSPQARIETAKRTLYNIRVEEERRMTNRALTQAADIFLIPIFKLLLPFIDLLTRLFVFKKEQMNDELVIKRVEVIKRELEAVASSLEKEDPDNPETKYAIKIVKEIHRATRQDPINKVRYAKGVYSALLKSYVSEVIRNDYRSGYSETGHAWRIYKVRQDAEERIDQAIDCLVKKLLARERDIGMSDTDLNKIVGDLLRQCLESVKDQNEQ